MYLNCSPSSCEKIAEQMSFFNLGTATSLGEGKMNSNQL